MKEKLIALFLLSTLTQAGISPAGQPVKPFTNTWRNQAGQSADVKGFGIWPTGFEDCSVIYVTETTNAAVIPAGIVATLDGCK